MGGIVSQMAAALTVPAPGEVTRDAFDNRYFGDSFTNAETVVHALAVFPVVSLIAETFGSFSLEFIRRDGEADGEVFPLAEVIGENPNPLTTAPEFWSTFAFNMVLRGRSYAEPVFNTSTDLELWQLSPLYTTEQHKERQFGVGYTYEDGRQRTFRAGELLTGTGLSTDGVYAIAPWKAARAAIEMANVLEVFGKSFFRNGARPSGVLSTANELSPEAFDRLKSQFGEAGFAGMMNAGKVPLLEGGLQYSAITAKLIDSEYGTLADKALKDVARNWRVPLSMLDLSDTAKTDEQEANRFVKYTMRPLTRRSEFAIARDLMTPEQRAIWKPRWNMDTLLRGDSTTQWRNAVLARTSSLASVNELRTKWFGLPKIDESWADDPREPLNSNRAADTQEGGMTAPQDRSDA